MERTTLFAPAKINLTLDITGKRPDGYHLLDSLFCTVSLSDILHLEKTPSGVHTRCPGLRSEENIASRAAQAFFARAGVSGGVTIEIEKHIPLQAGLGGGSSDCACTLRGLNALYGNPLEEASLYALAKDLGADVPFFLMGGLARAQGIGEILTPLTCPAPLFFVLVKPSEGMDTKTVYSHVRLDQLSCRPDTGSCIQALCQGDLARFAAHAGNVLYPIAQSLLPKLEDIRQSLLAQGALTAFMTGSGSCMVGLFLHEKEAQDAACALGGVYCCAPLP